MKRLLDPDSLRALARGCAVLGAGGGGDPYLGLLQALQATEDFGPVPLVDLDELPGDSLVMPCGAIGGTHEIMHLIDLADELGMPSARVDGQPMQVVVYTDSNSSVGLVVDQIFDIVEEHVDVTETADSHGIAGTAVIHGQVTDVIAVKQILRSAVPALFATASEVAA